MRQLYVITTIFILLQGYTRSWAGDQISAIRAPNTSYKYYLNSLSSERAGLKENKDGSLQSIQSERKTPDEEAKNFNEVDFSGIPLWQNQETLNSEFKRYRDLRYLRDPNHDSFLRRSTWLYPDDGCFARADLMRIYFNDERQLDVKKIFAFGDLTVQTNNSPRGEVNWWYHVAPVVTVDQKTFVLDPSIEPKRPLEVSEWLSKMTDNIESIQVAICAAATYDPGSDCYQPSNNNNRPVKDLNNFLPAEWERQQDLGRDPQSYLGDSPPWESNFFNWSEFFHSEGIEVEVR